jgi:hypothetical protein
MAALLVALAVMAVAMTIALPAWRHETQREKEDELIFRGRQYVRAVQLFQRRYAAAYAPDVDTLFKQKFLRKKYADPMVKDGEFEILYQGSAGSQAPVRGGAQPGQAPGGAGQTSFTFDSRSGAVIQSGQVRVGGVVGPRGGVIGVRSKNSDDSIRIYNGATHYNEWPFFFVPQAPAPGPRGGPGGPGGAGMRGGQGMGPGGMQGGRGGVPGGRGGGGERGGVQGGRGGPGGGQGPPQRGGRGQF